MTLRERLRRAEQRLATLRDQRADARRTYDEAAEALSAAPEDAGEDHEAVVAAREAREALEAADAAVETAEREQQEILRHLAMQQRPAEGDEGPELPEGVESLAPAKGDAIKGIVGSDARKQLARMAHGRSSIGRMSLGEAATREQLVAQVGRREQLASEVDRDDLAGLVQPDRRGLVAPILEPLSFLDFLPVGGTNSNLVQYVRATTIPDAAGEVATEGETKPEAGPWVFEDEDAPIRTIAQWSKQKKQVLDDAPFLEALIRNLLVYSVRRGLQAQVLAGDGTGEDLTGILNTEGILTSDEGDNPADRVQWGIVEVQDHLQDPRVVLFHPHDIARIRLMRDDSGASAGTGGYLFGPPSQAGASTIWNLPMVPERSLPQGTALVADPAGALVLLRSGLEVLVSDSDQDDFVKNRITILAELRAGLAVLRPEAFCLVDLGTGS